MNFVADESCARPVIQALREAGHDVVAIAEVAKGVSERPSTGVRPEKEARSYSRRNKSRARSTIQIW